MDAAPKPRRRRAVKAGKKTKPKSVSPLKMAAFLFCAFCLLGLGGLYLHLNWDFLVSDRTFGSSRQAGPGAVYEAEQIKLPEAAELYYYNGARLYSKGNYREALTELARVDRQSSYFEEARSLVLRIEERLLRAGIAPESRDTSAKGVGKSE